MIKINFKSGTEVKWEKDEYTDYRLINNMFVILKKKEYVGIYNMDMITSIRIK